MLQIWLIWRPPLTRLTLQPQQQVAVVSLAPVLALVLASASVPPALPLLAPLLA